MVSFEILRNAGLVESVFIGDHFSGPRNNPAGFLNLVFRTLNLNAVRLTFKSVKFSSAVLKQVQ